MKTKDLFSGWMKAGAISLEVQTNGGRFVFPVPSVFTGEMLLRFENGCLIHAEQREGDTCPNSK